MLRSGVNIMWSEALTQLARAGRQQREVFQLTEVGWEPPIDVFETQIGLLVIVALPGVQPDEIETVIGDGELTVRAAVKERQPHDTRYLLREYGVGDFYRTFRVSEQIDASRIVAEYADGVLKLHLPKVEAVKPRKISVKS